MKKSLSPSPIRLRDHVKRELRHRKGSSKLDEDEEEILERKRLQLQKELEMEIERERREQQRGRSSKFSGSQSNCGSQSRCSSPISSASNTCSSDISSSKSETSHSGNFKPSHKRRSPSFSSADSKSHPPSLSRHSPIPSLSSSNKQRYRSRSRSPLSSTSYRRARVLTPPHLLANKGEVKLDRHGNVRISLREKEKQRNLERQKELARKERLKNKFVERDDKMRKVNREKHKRNIVERVNPPRRTSQGTSPVRGIRSPSGPPRNFPRTPSRTPPLSPRTPPINSLSPTLVYRRPHRSPRTPELSPFKKKIVKTISSVKSRIIETIDENIYRIISVTTHDGTKNGHSFTTLLPPEDMSPISNNSSLGDEINLQEIKIEHEKADITSTKDGTIKSEVSEENFSDWSDGEDELLLQSTDHVEHINVIQSPDKDERGKEDPIKCSIEELQDDGFSQRDDALEAISDDEFDAMIVESQNVDSCNESQHSISGQMMLDVLDIDWASLVNQSRPKTIDFVPGSARKKFSPSNVLQRIGYSKSLAGEELSEKIEKFCKNELKEEFVSLKHPIASIHCLISENLKERCNLFSDEIHTALSARKDLEMRKVLTKSSLDFSDFDSLFTSSNKSAIIPDTIIL